MAFALINQERGLYSARGVWFETGADCSLPVDGAHAGTMDLSAADLPVGAVHYLCGPLPFMQAVRSSLIDRGVPAREIQNEVFGPDLWQADAVA